MWVQVQKEGTTDQERAGVQEQGDRRAGTGDDHTREHRTEHERCGEPNVQRGIGLLLRSLDARLEFL
jgi:hypothetical protein